jgi:hypothetical protein
MLFYSIKLENFKVCFVFHFHKNMKALGLTGNDDFEWILCQVLFDRPRMQEEGPSEALAHHHPNVGPKGWYVYSRRKKNVANTIES